MLLFVRQFFYVPPATAKETYLSPGLYAYWVWLVATWVSLITRAGC